MSIVILGATGQLGGLTISSLLSRGVSPDTVLATGRNQEALSRLAESGVRTAVVDYNEPDTLSAALAPGDVVLFISGNELAHRVEQHQAIIDAAASAKVARLVYTSVLRADATALPIAPDHKATEEALAASGLTTTILRNGWYSENFVPTVLGAAESGEIIGSAGDGRVAGAPRADFAEAAAVVLAGEGHEGAVYELGGHPSFTYAELAEVASELLGKPVAYRDLSSEEHHAALEGTGGYADYAVGLDASIREGALDTEATDLADLIGRPTTPLAEALRGPVSAGQ